MSFEVMLILLHLLCGKPHSRAVGSRQRYNLGMRSLPLHVPGQVVDFGSRVEQFAGPVVFQYSPNALNRVVLAVIRGVVGQGNGYSCRVCEVDDAFDKPSPSTLDLGSVVQVDHQAFHVLIACAQHRPRVLQAVHDQVGRAAALVEEEEVLIVLGYEQAEKLEYAEWREVMIAGYVATPIQATTRERPHLDRRLCINAYAQNLVVSVGLGIDLVQMIEDGVGLRNLL